MADDTNPIGHNQRIVSILAAVTSRGMQTDVHSSPKTRQTLASAVGVACVHRSIGVQAQDEGKHSCYHAFIMNAKEEAAVEQQVHLAAKNQQLQKDLKEAMERLRTLERVNMDLITSAAVYRVKWINEA
jgi:hypothetical protein